LKCLFRYNVGVVIMSNKIRLKTKTRLLESAVRIFAEKGYREATINEICDDAVANIAAVNYHFGDKAKLYDESWRYALEVSNELFPLFFEDEENHTGEERLRLFIVNNLKQILSGGRASYFPRFMFSELVELRVMKSIAREVFKPRRKRVNAILRTLLGDGIDEMEVKYCEHTLISQCMHMNIHMGLKKYFRDGEDSGSLLIVPNQDWVSGLENHIYLSVMATIDAIKAKYGKDE